MLLVNHLSPLKRITLLILSHKIFFIAVFHNNMRWQEPDTVLQGIVGLYSIVE